MRNKRHLQLRSRAGLGLPTLLAMLIGGVVQRNFAADTTGLDFDSAEQATAALYASVRNDDRDSIIRLIGPFLASSDDIAQDKADRDQFVKKYSEMHRLVKEPDGTTLLYIGAENWPFPVPLISDHGKWRFDMDAGAQEVVFRRIGENETAAVQHIAEATVIVCAAGDGNSRLTHWALLEDPEYAADLYRRELGSVEIVWNRKFAGRFADSRSCRILSVNLVPYAVQACLAYGFWLATLRHGAESAAALAQGFAAGIAHAGSALLSQPSHGTRH